VCGFVFALKYDIMWASLLHSAFEVCIVHCMLTSQFSGEIDCTAVSDRLLVMPFPYDPQQVRVRY
jgi:hypothetical protein